VARSAAKRPVQTPVTEAERFRALRAVADLVSAGRDLNEVLERVVVAVCSDSAWTSGSIMAADFEAGHSVLVTEYDAREGHGAARRHWELETSPTLEVVRSGRPRIIEDARNNGQYPGYMRDARARGLNTAVVLPLGVRDRAGRDMVLSVHSEADVPVTEAELAYLETVAGLTAIAVRRAGDLVEERAMSQKLRQAVAAQAPLMRRVLGGAGQADVIDLAETLLRCPVAVVDILSGRVHPGRSPVPDRLSDAEWRAAAVGLLRPHLMSVARLAEDTGFFARRPVNGEVGDRAFSVEAHVEPLFAEGERAGAVIAFASESGLDEFDRLIAEQVRFALSVQLVRDHARSRADAAGQAELMERLFQAGASDRAALVPLAARLGIDLAGPCRLAAIGFGAAEEMGATALAAALRALDRAVGETAAAFLAAAHDGDLVLLAPAGPEGGDTAWTRLLERIEAEVAWATGAPPIVASGAVCRGPERLVAARRSCARAIRAARALGRTGLVRETEFGALALLLSAADSEAAGDLVREAIGPLLEYDAGHGGTLAPTLRAYCRHGGRPQATADELGIHVTTLRYRLGRVRELFALNPDDPDTRFALDLALRLHRLGGAEA
jgi:sugar diacid utilization regulator